MIKTIVMPKLGESITEGTVIKWLKNNGQIIKKDENILIISTDKIEADIPSPYTGIIHSIHVKTGETVSVGTILADIEINTKNIINKKQITSNIDNMNNNKNNINFLSPLVKNIIKKHKINDISNIQGSGTNNRITKKDIFDYINKSNKSNMNNINLNTNNQLNNIQSISQMRATIMKSMIKSKQISAHATTFFDVDYTNIDKILQKNKTKFLKEEGTPLTYTTFLATGICKALKKHPYINAEIKNNTILFKKHINLGIAVAISTPEPGLIVPVLKNCDQMNLKGIAKNMYDLILKIKNKKILPDDLSGGTFTISNPGKYGSIIGIPIINQPQVAILCVGRIKKNITILTDNHNNDSIAIKNMGIISLSFDHRLIDGATADLFMSDLKNILETWNELY